MKEIFRANKKIELFFAILMGLIILYYGYSGLFTDLAIAIRIILSIIFALLFTGWVAFMLGYFNNNK